MPGGSVAYLSYSAPLWLSGSGCVWIHVCKR